MAYKFVTSRNTCKFLMAYRSAMGVLLCFQVSLQVKWAVSDCYPHALTSLSVLPAQCLIVCRHFDCCLEAKHYVRIQASISAYTNTGQE